MATAYGAIPRPARTSGSLVGVLPLEKKLRDSTAAVVVHISSEGDEGTIFAPRFPKLINRMFELFKAEIEDGNTYPQEELVDETVFRAYFLSFDAFVVLRNVEKKGDELDDGTFDWEENLLGFFYVKPNFPGRCSHICNGGFFTAPVARGRGVGRAMGEAFLQVVPALGYKASMFNLVFVNNEASLRLWRSLNFKEIGRIPKAGRLRSSAELVDAIIFYYDFEDCPKRS